MDVWTEDWTKNENDEQIAKAKERGCFLASLGCAGMIFIPFFVIMHFAIPWIEENLNLSSETFVFESTSPNGEHTLKITKKDHDLHDYIYFIIADDGTRVSVSTSKRGKYNPPARIEWYEDDKANIFFENLTSPNHWNYEAPNIFEAY